MPTTQRNCGTCQHWLRSDGKPMNQHGMHPCGFGHSCTYRPPQHTCRRWAKDTRITPTIKENT